MITIFPKRSLLLALTACIALPACETGDPRNTYGVTVHQFSDVVVPDGMRLRDGANESHSREEANWRMAHLVYTGQTRVDAIVDYLRRRMPGHSWELVAEAKHEGDVEGYKLTFERSIYSVQYDISRGDGATVMVVDYSTDYSRR